MKVKKSQIIKYIVFCIALIILFFAFFLIGGFAPFGMKDIFSHSETERYLSYYYELWDNFHNGSILFYSFKSGNGYDFSTVITYYLLNPLSIIGLFLPRNTIILFFNILYIFESALGGVFFFILLNCYNPVIIKRYKNDPKDEQTESMKKNNDSRSVYVYLVKGFLSFVYSFIPFLIPNGINSINVLSVIVLPLFFVGLNQIIVKNKYWLYFTSLLFLVLSDTKFLIVVFIASIIYIIGYSFIDYKRFIRATFIKTMMDIIGFMMCAPILFNNFNSTFFREDFNNDILQVLKTGRFNHVIIICVIFISLIMINSIINYCNDALSVRLNNVVCIVLIICISVLLIFVGVNTNNRKNKFSKYENSTVARVDKSIDYIRDINKNAKILVYYDEDDEYNPVANALFGYDYIINAADINVSESGLKYVDNVDGLDIWKIPVDSKTVKYLVKMITLPKTFCDIDFKTEFPFEKMNQLTDETIGIGDVFIPVKDNSSVVPNPKDVTNIDNMLVEFSFDKEGDYYTNDKGLIHLGELEPGQQVRVEPHLTQFQLKRMLRKTNTSEIDDKVFSEFVKYIEDNTNGVEFSDSKHEINVDDLVINKDKLVFLPYDIYECYIPYGNSEICEKSIFREKACILYADSKFVKLKYSPLFLIKGLLLSVVSIFLLVILLFKDRFKKPFIVVQKYSSRFISGKRIADFIIDNRIYYYIVTINLALALFAILINECLPFGNLSFVCGDGYLISYPYLLGDIENIKNGIVSVDSVLQFIDPFRLILFLCNNNNRLLIYNLYYLLHFLTLGPSIVFYLTRRPYGLKMKKTELKLIPISLAYSLSSYVMVYYSYAGFMYFAMLIPLAIMAMEKMIYEKKISFYIVLLSLFMIFNTYYAFMLCEMLLLYFFTLKFDSMKGMLKSGIRFAGCSIVSAGISFFRLIPFYLDITKCGYIEKDSSASQIIDFLSQNVLGNVSDIDMNYESIMVTDDWAHANAYAGLIVFTMVPLYFLIKNISLNEKIRKVCLLFLLYFSFGNEFLNYVMHGFHFQNLVPNRFSCFYIFIIITIFYEIIISYKDIVNKKGLLIFSIYTVLVLLVLYINNDFSAERCLLSAMFMILYIVVFALGYKKKKGYKCFRLLLLFLVVELLVSARHSIGKMHEPSLITENSIEYIKAYSKEYGLDTNITRHAEIINSDNYCMSSLLDMYSVSELSSVLSNESIRMSSAYGITTQNNNIMYDVGNPMANLFLNDGLFIYEESSYSGKIPHYYKLLKKGEDVTIYGDPYVVNKCAALPINILDKKNSSESFNDLFKQNKLSKKMVGQEIYSIVEADVELGEVDEKGWCDVNITLPDDVEGDTYLSDGCVVAYIGYHESGMDNDYSVSIKAKNDPNEKNKIEIGVLNEDALIELSEYLNNCTVEKIHQTTDILSFDVVIKEDSKMLIPVPAKDNYDIFVDGSKCQYDDILGGVTIDIDSGNHSVIVKTKKDGFNIYIVLSTLFFVIFIIYAFISGKHLKTNSEN